MSEPIRSLFTRRTLVVAIALTTIFVGLLYLEDRPWWCKFGVGFWSAAWSRCTSQHFLDPYSLTHLLHGVIFYFSWKASIAVFAVIELGLLYFVSDNFTLNVFMLVFPLESLKEWQLGGIGT